jgi:hypothetical protein
VRPVSVHCRQRKRRIFPDKFQNLAFCHITLNSFTLYFSLWPQRSQR